MIEQTNTNISDVYVGSDSIEKVYNGSDLVFQKDKGVDLVITTIYSRVPFTMGYSNMTYSSYSGDTIKAGYRNNAARFYFVIRNSSSEYRRPTLDDIQLTGNGIATTFSNGTSDYDGKKGIYLWVNVEITNSNSPQLTIVYGDKTLTINLIEVLFDITSVTIDGMPVSYQDMFYNTYPLQYSSDMTAIVSSRYGQGSDDISVFNGTHVIEINGTNLPPSANFNPHFIYPNDDSYGVSGFSISKNFTSTKYTITFTLDNPTWPKGANTFALENISVYFFPYVQLQSSAGVNLFYYGSYKYLWMVFKNPYAE